MNFIKVACRSICTLLVAVLLNKIPTLYQSLHNTHTHTTHECMHECTHAHEYTAMLFLEISFHTFPTSSSCYILSTPFSFLFPENWTAWCRCAIYGWTFNNPFFSILWPVMSPWGYHWQWWKEVSLAKAECSTVLLYKHSYLEDCLTDTLCPFSKIQQ